MARPRKYVRDENTNVVDGVSFHRRGGYYIINAEGQREYFGKGTDALERARQRYLDLKAPGWDRLRRRLLREVDKSVFAEQVLEKHPEIRQSIIWKLEEWGLIPSVPAEAPAAYAEKPSLEEEEDRQYSAWAQTMGVPDPTPLGEGARQAQKGEDTRRGIRSGPRVRDCLGVWRRWKTDEGRDAEYIKTVAGRFRQFVKVVGNRMVADLSAEDFVAWQQWVLKNSRKRRSGKWSNDLHANVKRVLRTAKRKKPNWPFPQGVMEWADSYDRRAYTADRKNREPMPVDVFHLLLAAADSRATADPEQFDKTTQRGRGQRLQALRRQREGKQLGTMLVLALNCGLDNVDCSRLRWNDLRRLDGNLPYLDLPRAKVTGRVGTPVDRRTPLLPVVAARLRQWRDYESLGGQGLVFRTARGGPYDSTCIGRAFQRLKEAAGITEAWTFKHIRNVGPTLARRAKRPNDERQAFLGHVVGGTSKFYEGDVDETYLIPLVNLIGEKYFDGCVIPTDDA